MTITVPTNSVCVALIHSSMREFGASIVVSVLEAVVDVTAQFGGGSRFCKLGHLHYCISAAIMYLRRSVFDTICNVFADLSRFESGKGKKGNSRSRGPTVNITRSLHSKT